MKPLRIAVASGKGGTGKTMVATSFVDSLSSTHSIQILDCDVEAPNTHLFLNPKISNNVSVDLLIPHIDATRCTLCGICVKNCVYNALAKIGEKIQVFPQICHGCGSCTLLCPEGAISEIPKEIGRIYLGATNTGAQFGMGELTISEPMGTPIIHQLKKFADMDRDLIIFDSPPGASCSVVATLYNTDYVIMVTEPTPFGLHDLQQMVGVLTTLAIPGGVIINRVGIGDDQVETYLAQTDYPILMKIPYDEKIAQGLARGRILLDSNPEFRTEFKKLYEVILNSAKNEERI